MLDALGKLSIYCSHYRFLSYVVGVVSLALFVYSLLNHSSGKIDFLVPGIVGVVWSLAFYGFSGLFLRVPERASRKLGFFRRIARNIHRLLFYVLGIGFIGLTLVVLYLSVKMLTIWFGEIPS